MLLALDIGNTNVTIGLFDHKELQATWRLTTSVDRMGDEYAVLLLNLFSHKGIQVSSVDKVVICSVVPNLTPTFHEISQSYFGIKALEVAAGVKTGVRILYENPKEVGADRIADAVAAYQLYGGPVIVLDFGTATVLDAVSKEGDYIGGAIAPGIMIAAEALFARAAKLYKVELVRPKTAIGKNTVTAIQSGLIYGYVGLVEGLIQRFKRELGHDSKVIATGGLAPIVAKETPLIDEINPELTLIGLRMIQEMNEKS